MNGDIDLYLRVREKEGRLYSDEIVRHLPTVAADHPLRKEWRAREASSDRLVRYLARFQEPIRMLDLGCGNGWLARRIADGADASVAGLDRNGPELRQARRVFAGRHGLSWIAADISCAPFSGRSFNVILIASAIQYFADLPRLIETLAGFLTTEGEIHILDSPLYAAEELPAARQRSTTYYERLGFPEMARHYYHHASTSVDPYHPVWLYAPRSTRSQEPPADSPFPWVCLRPNR